MEQRDSVILFGTGRGGTTLLLNMLACHPDLAWISNLNERFARIPALSVLSRARDFDSTCGDLTGWKRLLPVPAEAIEVPRYVTSGLFQKRGLLRKEDVDAGVIDRYREYIGKIAKWQGKQRFLQKHTGFARTEFLQELDGTARFVQIVRDGRAVAYSLSRVEWWSHRSKSWWGEMAPEYEEEYEESGRDPLILGAVVWKHLLDVTEIETASLPPGRLLTVSYTDFVREPEDQMQQICNHCALAYSERYRKRLEKFQIRNADEAWKAGLAPDQVDLLNRSLENHLGRYGFDM
jgi:hypothetical protein